MTKAIGDFPTISLNSKNLRTNRDAYADIPRVLSSNSLIHYTHITGVDNLGSNTFAPKNMISPAGTFGHDHSGGIWGKPFKRSIFQVSNVLRDEFVSSKFHRSHSANRFNFRFTPVPANTSKTVSSGLIPIWVPPCSDINGAYNSGGITATLYTESFTSANSGDIVTIKIINKTTNDSVTFTASTPTASKDRIYVQTSALTELLSLQNGAINVLKIEVKVATDGTDFDAILSLSELEIGVY